MLLLHGFPQFWWAWHQQLVDLADAGFRAVAVDLRGYGASDKPPRGYDAPTLAADIAAARHRARRAGRVVVGTDVGGLLAWTMAARHPRVVRSLAIARRRPPAAAAARACATRAAQRARVAATRCARSRCRGARRTCWPATATTCAQLFDRWSGPRWRGTPGYVADVARYAEAMRIHPVGYCAAEYFRWLVRSQLRPDGRRFAAQRAHRRSRRRCCSCTATSTPACCRRRRRAPGSYVAARYEWRLLDGVGHFPHNEVPELVSGELVRWAKLH